MTSEEANNVVNTLPTLEQEAATEIIKLISSARKLDRDLGSRKIKNFLIKPENDELNVQKYRIQVYILQALSDDDDGSKELKKKVQSISQPPDLTQLASETQLDSSKWQLKHGCLSATYPILDNISSKFPNKTNEDENFLKSIETVTLKLLKEDHTRSVQLTAGNVLAYLSKIIGEQVYENSKSTIFDLITENLRASHADLTSREDQLKSPEEGFDIHLPAALIRDKVVKESMGWSSLEPSLKCLCSMIENMDVKFCKYVDEQLIDLVWACLSHHNRFVRETGFHIICLLLDSAPLVIKEFNQKLAEHLKDGLADNWNQVRLAASAATRKFLTTCDNKESFYPILLPRLCLNRYYKAEGVRAYTQESWRLVFGTEGRYFVAKYFSFMVDAYISASASSNPAEREAACSSISELLQKIDKDVVSTKVVQLLSTLTKCSKDESWSVRDAANLAFGNCTKYYPETAQPFLNDFYPVLFKTLEDPIPLLRQGAASSLATIVLAYGVEAKSVVMDKIVDGLQNLEKVNETESDNSSSPENTTTSEETKVVEEENACTSHFPSCDYAATSGNTPQVITMETLTSRFEQHRSSKSPTTCPKCLRSKTTQPWHLVDGCLYLVGALAEITPCQSELSPLIPLIARAAKVKSFTEHYIILETVCKIIPLLAKSIGKKPFKEFLTLLFDPIFSAIESPNPVTSTTGKATIRFLAEFIGPNILKSRVELYDAKYLSLIEECHIEEVSLTSGTR